MPPPANPALTMLSSSFTTNPTDLSNELVPLSMNSSLSLIHRTSFSGIQIENSNHYFELLPAIGVITQMDEVLLGNSILALLDFIWLISRYFRELSLIYFLLDFQLLPCRGLYPKQCLFFA